MAKILDTVRHIVFLELKRRREVMRIGGLGVVVEMDESLLNHNTSHIRSHGEPKPEYITQTECQQWCFSILERKVEGIPQKRVVYMVPDRTQATIEAIIARHVMPGSICHTDGGACYQRKEFWQSRGLIWIEHKKCTKHPITGKLILTYGGTNSIESFWASLKRTMWAVYHTIPEEKVEEYVLEIVWRVEKRSSDQIIKDDLHTIMTEYLK